MIVLVDCTVRWEPIAGCRHESLCGLLPKGAPFQCDAPNLHAEKATCAVGSSAHTIARGWLPSTAKSGQGSSCFKKVPHVFFGHRRTRKCLWADAAKPSIPPDSSSSEKSQPEQLDQKPKPPFLVLDIQKPICQALILQTEEPSVKGL